MIARHACFALAAVPLALAACDGRPGSSHPPEIGPDGGHTTMPPPPMCRLTACENAVLTTCDRSFGADCSEFGGTCSEAALQIGDSTEVAPWCTCGDIPDGYGVCAGGRMVVCESGVPNFYDCVAGTLCGIQNDELGCQCDDNADGVCPGGACMDDPDCTSCTPACSGLECGDNGCGGSCGSCGVGYECLGGHCLLPCLPTCESGTCGSDGCGGTCACPDTQGCVGGRCVSDCVPSCSPGSCADDGCGHACPCASGQSCAGGVCQACVPDCSGGHVCGPDGCGGTCGTCPAGDECAYDSRTPTHAEYCGCFFGDHSVTFDASLAHLSESPLRVVTVWYRSGTTVDGRTRDQHPFDDFLMREGDAPVVRRYRETCADSVEVELHYVGPTGEEVCVVGPQILRTDRVVIPDIDRGCPTSL